MNCTVTSCAPSGDGDWTAGVTRFAGSCQTDGANVLCEFIDIHLEYETIQWCNLCRYVCK